MAELKTYLTRVRPVEDRIAQEQAIYGGEVGAGRQLHLQLLRLTAAGQLSQQLSQPIRYVGPGILLH
jgi:hypothetical protein